MIAIYDDNVRTLALYKLDTVEDLQSKSTGYGSFSLVHKIHNFWMLQSDIVLESGTDQFFYLAR